MVINTKPARDDPHVGSLGLDLGLEVAMLDTGRYHTLAERLRGRDFEPDKNEQGNLTRQRWTHKKFKNVKVDSWTTRTRVRPCACSARISRRSILTGHVVRRSSFLGPAMTRSAETSPGSWVAC